MAYAELCYRCAADWASAGSIPVTKRNLGFLRGAIACQGVNVAIMDGDVVKKADPRFGPILGGLVELGNGYLRRVKQHADPTGALAEQFDRNDGSAQSARDLTWSYAAVLTAFQRRELATKKANGLQRVPVLGGSR